MKKLFEKIALERKRYGPGYIHDLCFFTGIAPSTFWRWRKGKTTPSKRALSALKLTAGRML